MIFGKKVIEYKMGVSIFSINVSETFIILRRTVRDMIKKVYDLHVKYPVMLV